MSKNLQRGINAFVKEINAPLAAFFSSCVHCGICAEACLFYTETGDPRYTPINKLAPMRRVWEQEYTLFGKLKKALGFSKPVTEQELAEWELLVYDGCTLCGRCSTVCPVGNDISMMIRKTREGYAAAGYAPEGVKGASMRALKIGSPMGVKFPALKAQIGHVESETGLTVPVDVEGADYMALLSSMEIINFPEYLSALTRIFHQAGVSWTLCSAAFEATNAGVQIGSSEVARELVSRVVEGAERLKVKYVIAPECGHAYTAIRWEGPNLIGRPYRFQVVHILELLDQLKAQGRFQTKGEVKERVTFHDPCQIVRKGGVLEPPRNLLKSIAPDFVEMADHGKFNWCCGGGGGVSSNDRAEHLRLQVFARKTRQLKETKAHTLVTACANCRLVMEEGMEAHHVEMPIVGLTELLADHLLERNP